MVSHHLEVERKYELATLGVKAPAVTWQFEGWVVDDPVSEELDATYFDTARGQLGAYGVALRRRLGGYDEGWHIKYDVSGERHEVSFSLSSEPEEMPTEVQRFVQVLGDSDVLEPRVGLTTHRVRTVLRDAQGRALAEICDDTVRSIDYATGIERSWQEWEVELLEGVEAGSDLAQGVFGAVEKSLRAVGAQPSSSPAKIARALGKDVEFERRWAERKDQRHQLPGQGVPADSVDFGGAHREAPAESVELLARIMRRYSIKLGQADLLIRAGVPDSTHRGRVAARQLRSILTFMAVPYARDEQMLGRLQELLRGLKIYASQLEQHRNGELILPMTERGVARTGLLDEGDLVEVAELGQAQMQAGLVQAMAYLDSPQRRELQRSLERLTVELGEVVSLPDRSEKYVGQVARHLQKKLVKRGYKQVKAWPETAEDFAAGALYDEGIHDVRKLSKAVRYCLNACAGAGVVLSQEQDVLLKSARLLQSELGKLTDELTFLGWLKGMGDSPSAGVKPFTVGCLAGRSEHVSENLREDIYQSVPGILQNVKSIDV